jgi:extracellular elastinolytic metalloproteinase
MHIITESIAPSTPSVPLDQAIKAAESALHGQYNSHPATLEYLVKDDGSAILTHVVQIENQATGDWHQAFVDAHSGQVVSVIDFRAESSVCLFSLL